MKILFIALIIGVLLLSGCTSTGRVNDTNSDNNSVMGGEVNDSNFVVFVLPDTQVYSESHPDIFLSQTNWVKDNFDDYNAVFVVHEGDIVNNSGEERQWQNASSAISVLSDNNIPFLLVPGNHDSASNPNSFFQKYFPPDFFEGKSWYKGNIGDNTSSYSVLNINGREFLFLGLDVCPDQNEISWANNIFSQNEEKYLVLVTHGYLNENGERSAGVCGNTQYLWDDLIRLHKNLGLTLSGHMHGENYRVDPNDFNVEVNQLLADYQTMEKGGNGYLRVLTFVPSQNKIVVDTYSPYLDKYLESEGSSFILDYNFNLN